MKLEIFEMKTVYISNLEFQVILLLTVHAETFSS